MSLLAVESLSKSYRVPGGAFTRRELTAVDGVSLGLDAGETVGVVGESGSGKSTLARCILQLERPTAGRVGFDGHDLTALAGRDLRRLRRHLQMVFQDPAGLVQPPAPGGLRGRGAAPAPRTPWRGQRRSAPGSRSCSPGSASAPSTSIATRTSSRAASNSASPSRARWPASRASSRSTSRRRPSTCRSRPRCSPSSASSRRGSASPISSSPTTSPSSAAWRGGSW